MVFSEAFFSLCRKDRNDSFHSENSITDHLPIRIVKGQPQDALQNKVHTADPKAQKLHLSLIHIFPFQNQPNDTNPYAGTPLGELMALDFMIKELSLYLDTHPDDQEVFEALKSVIQLAQEGEKKYTQLYGPVSVTGVVYSDSYDWTHNPWPWENAERGAK